MNSGKKLDYSTQMDQPAKNLRQRMSGAAKLRGTSKFSELLRSNLPVSSWQEIIVIAEKMNLADKKVDGFELYIPSAV